MSRATSIFVMVLAATAAVGGWAGCSNDRVRRNPPLVAEKEPIRKPGDDRSFLDKAGEATVNVVTAPVRLVVPDKKPTQKKEPERWEPAEVIILGPPQHEEQPATEPATRP